MNVIPFKITGTEEALIRVKAGAVYFRSAVLSGGAVDETIIVTAQGNAETLILEPGQGCPVDGQITEWRIRSLGGVGTVEGKLVFGNAGFTDNRLQVSGAVEVVDGGRSRTDAGVAFMGSCYAVPVAGAIGMAQLYNPTADKNAVIEQVWFAGQSGAPANTYAGLVLRQVQLAGVAASPTNKKAGGAASSMQMRTGSNAAPYVGNNLTGMVQGQVYKFTEPLILPPGWSLLMQTNDAGGGVQMSVEFYELLIGA